MHLVSKRLMILGKDQTVVGGQEAPGKLGEQPSFPTNPVSTEAASIELHSGECGEPAREGVLEVTGTSAHHTMLSWS